MAAKKRAKQKSGYQKMRDAGKRPMLLGLTEEEYEVIQRGAKLQHRSMTNFVVNAALGSAYNAIEIDEHDASLHRPYHTRGDGRRRKAKDS